MEQLNKIGVVGIRGRVGSELVRRGCTPIDCDVLSKDSVMQALASTSLDALINCAGYTTVDDAEDDIFKCYGLNAFAPETLRKAFAFEKLFVHISSDFIFNGVYGPYTENGVPAPLSTYGFSKFMGEVGLSKYKNVLIIRTTVLYDTGPKPNFILSAYEKLKRGEIVQARKDLVGSPTYVPHLADGILSAIDKNLTGILNIAGDTVCSRYELAGFVARVFGFETYKIEDAPTYSKARRPKRAGLLTDKARSLGIPIYDVYNGLTEFRREMEKKNVS